MASHDQIDRLFEAAEQGDAEAQIKLGDCYKKGEGVMQDYVVAVKWYRLAAEQGNAVAQLILGVCYFSGNGVTQDHDKAVAWYSKAAEQGHAFAQTWLSYCYCSGKGVVQDLEEAEKWCDLAAQQGEANAEKLLKQLDKRTPGHQLTSIVHPPASTPVPTPERRRRKSHPKSIH